MDKLINELAKNGIFLSVEQNTLKVKYNGETISKDLQEKIKTNKEELLKYLNKANINLNYESVPQVKNNDSFELSSAQRRLWILSQFGEGSVAYNLPGSIHLNQDINIDLFKRSIDATIERHEILRTVFKEDETGEVRQWILNSKNLGFKIDYKDFREEKNKQELIRSYIREDSYKPFDLATGPLLRASLLQLEEKEYVFYYNMHHIISDGGSMKVLSRDIFYYYEGYKKNREPELKPLKIQYKDYSAWQLGLVKKESSKSHRDYWLQRLSGELPQLNLPSTKRRPRIKTSNGVMLHGYLNKEVSAKLKEYTQEHGGTLFMGLLASFNVLLYRYTGQNDIILGSPIAGREHADLEDQIGFYVNTLALRNEINAEENFDGLFSKIKQNTLDAYSHQMYPFDQLVEELNLQRDTSRSAVFDIMLVLQNGGERMQELQLEKEELNHIKALGNNPSKFDMEIAFQEIGDYLSLHVVYNPDVYEEDMVEGLITHYRQLLTALLENPEEQVSKLDYLSKEEKHNLLSTFNDTQAAYPEKKTIVDLFEEQVAKTPNNIAVVFEEKDLTYKELHEHSNKLAAYLQKNYKIKADDLVGIKLERSEWMVISILGVLKSGGAYVPIDPSYPQDRMDYIEKDTNYKVCIDEKELKNFKENQDRYSTKKVNSSLKSDNLVYVIYTSGSTGNPKGVLLEHSGVVNRLLWMGRDLKIDERDVFLQKTPTTFDVSVWELLLPLVSGSKLVVSKPEGHKDPLYIENVIKDYKVSVIHFVPSMLSGMLENIQWNTFESLRHVVCSGEALTKKLEGIFKEKSIAKLHNYYGPTEASVDVTAIDLTQFPTMVNEVSIGKPVDNTCIYIVNEKYVLQGVGVTGEILIGGVQIARGYLNKPELTAEKFIANPFKKGERLYKTGDLGRWTKEGTIDFIGRKDNQVKIRGYRIELGEIEHALLKNKQIKEAIVLAKENENKEKELIAYITAKEEQHTNDLRSYLKELLPEYMLPAFYVQLEALPLTSNGKIDKKLLPDPHGLSLDSGVKYVAPRNELEEKMVKIWQDILKRENIGIKDDFFTLGGNSLKAIRLSNEYLRELEVRISLKDLFTYTTLVSHEELIQSSKKSEFIQIEKIAHQASYPMSNAQHRLWVLSQFKQSSVTNNMPGSIYLNSDINIDCLKKSIDSTIERHEILRTVFKADETGEIRQWILKKEDLDFKIDYIDFKTDQQKKEVVQSYIREDAFKAFDLEKGPLLRATLIKVEDEAYVFYYNMHHIISDGWSMDVLSKDLFSFYDAYKENREPELEPLRIQYKDYSAWQLSQLEEESFKAHKAYWLNRLGGELPLLDLPNAKQRPKITTHNGHGLSTSLTKETTKKLASFSQNQGGSLYTVLLASWNVLMYRYTGQKDIIIGTPIAGREHADLENQIGFYLNTLAFRNHVNPEQSFKSFHMDVKESTLVGYTHQAYPFDLLVEELDLIRDTSRRPIFDVLLDFHNTGEKIKNIELNEKEINSISDLGKVLVKYDVELHFTEVGDHISIQVNFNRDIYEKNVIEGVIKHYKNLISQLIDNSNESIGRIDFLSNEEKEQLIIGFNDTKADYPKHKTIVNLFEEQAEKNPNNIAVVFEKTALSYKQVDELSNKLANYLREVYRIAPDDLIGIQLDRSEWVVVAILGVLKAGGAYVPIDPEYPSSRKEHIIKDTSLKLLITEANIIQDIDYYEGEVFAIDVEFPENQSSEKLPSTITSNNLAYVIYTSGSTGQPKGVMVEHKNLVNSTTARMRAYNGSYVFLLLSSISFDSSIAGIFGTLISGGQLVLTSKINGVNLDKILEIIEMNKISQLLAVPSLYKLLLNRLIDKPNTLKIVTVAGEECPKSLVELHHNSLQMANCELYNEYGPTECTVWASYIKYNKKDVFNSSIGKPISNTQIYVLSEEEELQPIGVIGEICIGGAGLTRGYLNQEKLTKEKFIENPFKVGERIYKTGDLGKWTQDGDIEFLGRKDDQVKIRGYRIELGEIEQALQSHLEIEAAVVIAKENENKEKELVAYITSRTEQSINELRSYLKELLPEYMIPTHYVQLNSFPLTSNGKIDKKALPDPQGLGLASGVEYIAPRNEIEEKLVQIWEEVLQRDSIGVKDDFFALGGHSLNAVRVISKIQKEFNIKFEFTKIFELTTIEKIAEFIAIISWNYSTVESEMDEFKI